MVVGRRTTLGAAPVSGSTIAGRRHATRPSRRASRCRRARRGAAPLARVRRCARLNGQNRSSPGNVGVCWYRTTARGRRVERHDAWPSGGEANPPGQHSTRQPASSLAGSSTISFTVLAWGAEGLNGLPAAISAAKTSQSQFDRCNKDVTLATLAASRLCER
jgi:hypothetical protein